MNRKERSEKVGKSRGFSILIPVVLAFILAAGIGLLVLPPALQDLELTREAEEEEELYRALKTVPVIPPVTPSPDSTNNPEKGKQEWNPFPGTTASSALLPLSSPTSAGPGEETEDGVLPEIWYGAYARRSLLAAAALFSFGENEKGKQYMETAFTYYEKWNAIPKGTKLPVGAPWLFGDAVAEKGSGLITLSDGSKELLDEPGVFFYN